MKIVFDHQIFQAQKYGGISQYFAELYKRLSDSDITIRYSRNRYIDRPVTELPSQKYLEMAGYYLIDFLNKQNTILQLSEDFDIFHPTYYNPYFLKHLGSKPYVITVFDMAHERYPEMFGDAAMIIRNKKLVVENATRIIAISQSTKDDMLQEYEIDPDLITVIHLATSLTPMITPAPSENRYILFVGSREAGYKGFYEFAKAVGCLLREDKDLHVVCAGGGPLTNEEICMFYPDVQSRVYQVTFKNNDELAGYYQDAEVVVFPSWIEGFGIPQLEAMTCGCPIACSDIPVFHEITGDVAEYFDPKDTESIRSAIVRASRIGRNGQSRAKEFSWDKMAEQTIKVYESCLQ
jgi:glycosyltransferase involved in cell wall biosynthesis